jgi:FkbM family methyltransferase
MSGPLKGYLWSTSSSYDYILGEYENPETMSLFLSWLKPDSVFYDIGSNIGYHALVANTIITEGEIYAFEPMPEVRAIFEKHISLNKNLIIQNCIKISPLAISNQAGEVLFSNDVVHREGNTYINTSYVFSSAKNKITVPCQSVDGFLQQGNKAPDVIKIDVEGAEYDVLTGAKNTLMQYKPNILLATHDCHLRGVQEKCVDFLIDLGYDIRHTGKYNKHITGLDDYIAIHKTNFNF